MNCSESPLGRYLSAHGGAFHPVLEFRTDTFGTSIYASTSLPEHTPAVSCPFSLTVTPTLALSALSSVLPSTDDHELMVTYLALHRLSPSDLPASVILAHKVYVDSLPKDEDMRTPLYFSEAEMELLKGTNLFGATEDRRKSWKAEWEHVVSILAIPNPALFTWDLYLWACTILSSRAFPSSLLPNPIGPATPVLFPGVDTLNHAFGQRVSWLTDVHAPTVGGEKGTLSIVLDEGVLEGSQAFNTYGPKANEELVFGFGFALRSNPGDIVALKLSLSPTRHVVPRSGVLPPALILEIRRLVATAEEKAREVDGWMGWENELEGLGMLGDMLEGKLGGVLGGAGEGEGARSEVREMCEEYRRGQVEILQKALEVHEAMMGDLERRAAEAGVVLFGDEDDSEDE